MSRRHLAVLVTALVLLSGCGGSAAREGRAADGRLAVVAGFYPLAFLVEQVGGPAVHVLDLTPPGVEPHDVELTARQAALVDGAALVAYLRGLSPAVDAAAEEAGRAVDLSARVPLRGGDLHVWLDPKRMETIARELSAQLEQLDPDRAADYRARAAAVVAKLSALDAELSVGLARCTRTEVITAHSAFGYFTDRYGLTEVGITGLTPDAEPGPGRLAEVTRIAKAKGATTIFFESLVSPKVAETVASAVGASTAVLDPIETKPNGGDYFSAMRSNLTALRKGLDCA